MSEGGALPLERRFPALGALPRAALGTFPSPVQPLALPDAAGPLWVKRDDLDAPRLGGNKVRALEFLLGAVRPGDLVLTLGGAGSTHVLATAVHAATLGARTRAVRWPHEMNATARAVAAEITRRCEHAPLDPTPVALARLALWRLTVRAGRAERVHYVPLGGSTPLGVLGHVNAALELADQVAAGELPAPRRIVVPLGSGGTAAGLALGLAAAGLATEVVGARVAPRLGATRGRVLRLAAATRRYARRIAGVRLPPPAAVRVVHDAYGGAYGRELPAAARAAALLHDELGIRLDATYSAKAAAAALALARETPDPTLFWLTFDARWLGDGERSALSDER
ncbi:MAG TPA: pyridoxal-phosphate dependent enzyme [Gemmatimonadaceae bacterium]|nr:pyridoxal-phosphate dependent enzyme [Gemmatimonadaceae bacterium]